MKKKDKKKNYLVKYVEECTRLSWAGLHALYDLEKAEPLKKELYEHVRVLMFETGQGNREAADQLVHIFNRLEGLTENQEELLGNEYQIEKLIREAEMHEAKKLSPVDNELSPELDKKFLRRYGENKNPPRKR